MKALVVFDLDGTLAESKSSIDAEMARSITSLLGIVKVAGIFGGARQQFEQQVLAHLSHGEGRKNLSLRPIGGTKHGIDETYGVRTLRDVLHIAIDQMIFVGDEVFPDGNDFPAKQAGPLTIAVKDPHETKGVVEAIIACPAENP